MNPLSLKLQVNKYFILSSFLLLSLGLIANDSIPKIDFLKHCKNSDSYLVYSYTDVTYTRFWGRYKRAVSVENKLVVNTGSGVDKYAYLNIPEQHSDKIIEFEVKTLKADGTSVELDSSLVFHKNKEDEKLGEIRYPIPGVEPGDTIFTKYMYSEQLSKYEMKDFINLYASVPSLKTEYSVKSGPELQLKYKGYNGFSEPIVVKNDSLVYCVFQKEIIKGFEGNEFSCLPCELPYGYYTMENVESEMVTWNDVYNNEFNFITQPLSLDRQNAAYYGRWKKNVLGIAKDSSKFHQFRLLHKNILENFQINEIELGEELIKTSGYFLKNKRFDPISLRRIFRQVLEDLEIDYWAVFARSKRLGKLDPYFIRRGEYDHIFYAFKDEKGDLNLLYPHDVQSKYEINEIPPTIFNTEAVIARPIRKGKLRKNEKFISKNLQLAEADSLEIETVILPGSNVNQNNLKQVVYSDINLNEKTAPIKYRFSVTGGMFTEFKDFVSLLQENKEASEYFDTVNKIKGEEEIIVVDSILDYSFNESRPYGYEINAQGSLNGVVSFVNENMVSFSLDKLLQHISIESEMAKTDLNYYLDYGYSDFLMAIFNFPKEIEILNLDQYNVRVDNEIGEYLFDIKHIGGNQLTIQSRYKIIQDIIPKTKYELLKQINKTLKEVKNKHILIKLKG